MAKRINPEILNEEIIKEYGIDISKYRNTEITDTLASLIVFPQYIISGLIKALVISFIIFIIGFFIIDLVHVEYILYSTIGLVLFAINGLLLGIIYMTYMMKNDIISIVNYGLDIMIRAIHDTQQIGISASKRDLTRTLNRIFTGITHIVMIPIMTNVVSNRIPFVGWAFAGLVNRILSIISSKLTFDIKSNVSTESEVTTYNLRNFDTIIEKAKVGTATVISAPFYIARFPVILIASITMLILILVLWILN